MFYIWLLIHNKQNTWNTFSTFWNLPQFFLSFLFSSLCHILYGILRSTPILIWFGTNMWILFCVFLEHPNQEHIRSFLVRAIVTPVVSTMGVFYGRNLSGHVLLGTGVILSRFGKLKPRQYHYCFCLVKRGWLHYDNFNNSIDCISDMYAIFV